MPTMGLIKNTFLASNIYMAINPYKVCNKYAYKILFDLSESSKITFFKDLFSQIIKVKPENRKTEFKTRLKRVLSAFKCV